MSSLVEWNPLVLFVKFQRQGLPRFLCHGFNVTKKPLGIILPRQFVSHPWLLFVYSPACYLSRTNLLVSPSTSTAPRPSSLAVTSLRSPTATAAHRPTWKVNPRNIEARNVGWTNLIKRRRGHTPQSLEYSPILPGEKRDSDTSSSRPRSPTNPVKIHPRLFRHIIIDDVTYLRNIQAPRRYIRGNQETSLARPESLNGHVSLPLRKITMYRHRIITISMQCLSKPVASNLSSAEHETSANQVLF